mgnify:CR=1 FL=1
MTTIARPIILLTVCAWALSAATPLAATEHFASVWFDVRTSGPINRGSEPGPWRYSLLGQFRYYDTPVSIRQWVLRPGIAYRIDSRFSVAAGYGFHRSMLDGFDEHLDEHRVWQQLQWNMAYWGGAVLKSRTRLEQRVPSGLSGTGFRLRERLRLESRFGPEIQWKFIIGVEALVNLRNTSWTTRGYSETRFFTGFGLDMNSVNVETGYLHQRSHLSRIADQVNHVLVLSLGF